jgi:T3SS negative regulator,GrlR
MTKSIEGLWTVIYSHGSNYDGGIVVFNNGQVLGGDNQYFYVGNYSVTGSQLTCKVQVIGFIKGAMSIFGFPMDHIEFLITGIIQADEIIGKGSVVGIDEATVSMRLSKRAEVAQ